MTAHSYSSLKCFDTCARKYFHLYQAKDVKDGGTKESTYGDDMHKMLARYINEGAALPADHAKAKALLDTLRGRSDHLMAERRMAVRANLKPCEFFDGATWMRGVLDVLAVRGDTAVCLDWKYGKRRPDFLQLKIFALLAFQNYPKVQSVQSSFLWMADGMAQDKRTYTREDIPGIVAELQDKMDRVQACQQHDNWPLNPSGLCGWCPVTAPTCPYGRHPIEKEDEE